ncbi:MAG: TAXI family TRAP transporter solute-binding subunit [Amaricoccus sp.]
MLRVLAVLALVATVPAAAQEISANLVAGEAGSTELRAGEDLAALAAGCGLRITARETGGAVENMQAVRDRRATQLGIVQGDVLEYFRTYENDDPALRRPAQGVRVVFPLFDEEVHVVARREIGSFADLAGKRVATGLPGSGTSVTAGLILDLAQVQPAERQALAPDAALAALRAGDVDAVIDVAGVPDARLVEADLDPASFHLLPLDAPALTAAYAAATIPSGTYAFAPAPVAVVSVPAYLVTFDFDPRKNGYQAASCRMVADLGHLVVSRLDELRATGHPKWASANLRTLPDGWAVSPCVLAGLDPAYDFTCRRPDGSEVREGPGAAEGDEANRLYLDRICSRLGAC